MATRFYFSWQGSTAGGGQVATPAFNAGWEQTGEASRLWMAALKHSSHDTSSINENRFDTGSVTVPITTTQDILCIQYVSSPLPYGGYISGTFSLVIRVGEAATTNNVTLAVVVSVISEDGTTNRGTLFSTFNTDTEFALTSAPATRIVNAVALTPLSYRQGDRILVEVGGHAAAPSAAGSFLFRNGFQRTNADFALTSALTTDLNPWCEFSQNLFAAVPNNYQFIKAGDGISVSEKIR